ncbi:phosphatase PAP2 family protein [Nocardia africana]|uniref:phosphatase PAP2 family protein n=1 Tax=Nocardia africana TaxID=134964 RepID=UPI0007A54191|nr:phosphatase PAP2 family protein [Nocardia africana]MCC3313366.1 phosphatase PAP2 family protein [Nocardia africana]
MSVDLDILRLLADHRAPALTVVARWAMDIGTNGTAMAAVAGVGLAVVAAKRWWWQGIVIAVSVVSAQAVARALKQMIQRARPPEDLAVVQVGAFSMPSTVAAMTAAVVVAAYAVLPWPAEYRHRVVALLAVLLVVIGVAMIYLGAHWPTDVLAGWGVGFGVGAAVVGPTRVWRRWEIRRKVSGRAPYPR